MAGFPYEYNHENLTDRSIPLFKQKSTGAGSGPEAGTAQAGEDFSDKTVLAAAVEEGLLQFERRIPEILAGSAVQESTEKYDGGETDQADAGNKGAVNIAVGGTKIQGPHIPQNAFEENYKKELTSALRRLGQAYPLAGYTMDLSIWLFREGSKPTLSEDAGPAARVSPVAWTFQDDLYMMRHMARLQAGLTHRSRESIQAAEAAACAVFLAIHGSTKPYIAGYLEKEFGYRIPAEEEMREEILRAGGTRMLSGFPGMSGGAENTIGDGGDRQPGSSLPALCVRAAMSAFLNGRDFEDVLRRAVSMGGNSADIAAIAGSIAEAFFGIPDEIRDACLQRLPVDLRTAAKSFAARDAQKKAVRESNPAAKARWENALIRASSRHPATVQGNEPLEQAIDRMLRNKNQQTFIEALEMLRFRMNNKGRVFVPIASARRAETADVERSAASAGNAAGAGNSADTGNAASAGNSAATGSAAGTGNADVERSAESTENTDKTRNFAVNGASGREIPQNAMVYSMQAIRTKDGKVWQPAYTSRAQLDKANAAMAKARAGAADGTDTPASGTPAPGSGMVLSYSMDALFRRFLPAGSELIRETVQNADNPDALPDPSREIIPENIQGIVLNPYDKAFYIPRKTIEAIFVINREAAKK